MRLFLGIFGLLMLAVPLATPTAAPFAEDWGTPSVSDWRQVTGTGIGPECSPDSCVLAAAVPCCSSDFSRYRHDLAGNISDGLTLSFRFVGTSTSGGSDALLQLGFNVGHLHVELTEPPANNRAALHTTGNAQTFAGSWSANAWYTATVTIDGAARSARLSLTDAAGDQVGQSNATPLPAGATTLSYVDFQGANWGSAVTFRYDDLLISKANGDVLLAEDFEVANALVGWTVEGQARIDCTTGNAPCSLEATGGCCGAWTRVTRYVSTASDEGFRVEFDLLPPSESWGDDDAVVQVRLDHGDLNLELTEEGYLGAGLVYLHSTDGSRTYAGQWTPGSWTHASVRVFPKLHLATLVLTGPAGLPLGPPAAVTLYADADALEDISFQAARWTNNVAGPFHYDNIQVVPNGS